MVTNDDVRAEQFTEHRPRLRSIAYRMLGSHTDADDAVQETWLRLQRTDAAGDPQPIDNLGGWLTTVISRVCLDQIRSRRSRPEDALTDPLDEASEESPETVTLEADAVGAALVVVLEQLAPVERLAFVLHDVFALPYDEIAPIVDRSPTAARQLASRARRRIQGVQPSSQHQQQRQLVAAFLAAAREGDFGRLLQILDPEVELHTDPATAATAAKLADRGAPLLQARAHGADAVARVFAGRAVGAQPALIEGEPGAVWAPHGRPRTVFAIHVVAGRITRIEVTGDRAQLDDLDIVVLPADHS